MSDQKEGLVGASEFTFACKGVKEYDDIDEVGGFYLSDIEYVHKNYYKNKQVLKYVTALLQNKRTKTMIDSDMGALNNWLESDKENFFCEWPSWNGKDNAFERNYCIECGEISRSIN